MNDKFSFKIGEAHSIPTLIEKSVKRLGKLFQHIMRDQTSLREMGPYLQSLPTQIEKSGLPNRFITWIYQHEILDYYGPSHYRK